MYEAAEEVPRMAAEVIKVVEFKGKLYFKLEGLDILFYWIDPIFEWAIGLGKISISRSGHIIDEGSVVQLNLEEKNVASAKRRGNSPIGCFFGLRIVVKRSDKEGYVRKLLSQVFKEGDEISVHLINKPARGLEHYIRKAFQHRLEIQTLKQENPQEDFSTLFTRWQLKKSRGIKIPVTIPDVKVMDPEFFEARE
jgi:hypothetical protein